MASAPKVGATTAPSGAPPVSGWSGAGAHRFTSADHIDAAAGAGSFGVDGGWRPHYDDRHGQGYFFFGQYPPREDPDPPLFTPFMALQASAFAATQPLSDLRPAEGLLIADMLHGIAVYDYTLRVIAGTWATQGAMLNRYG
jgi:hypothetical protein